MLVGTATNSQPTLRAAVELGEASHFPKASIKALRLGIGVLLCVLIAACSSSPSKPTGSSSAGPPGASKAVLSPAAKDVLFNAISLVGTPYRYGGNTPQGGFDCSGLVGYVYRQGAGLNLPRTTAQISRTDAKRVRWGQLVSGDLVLFGSGKVTHIGIYVGDGRFVHAPSTGGTVRLDRLTDAYWVKRFQGGRRLL